MEPERHIRVPYKDTDSRMGVVFRQRVELLLQVPVVIFSCPQLNCREDKLVLYIYIVYSVGEIRRVN